MERFLPLLAMGILFLVLLVLVRIRPTRQALISMWRRGGLARLLTRLFMAAPMATGLAMMVIRMLPSIVEGQLPLLLLAARALGVLAALITMGYIVGEMEFRLGLREHKLPYCWPLRRNRETA
jgi:hypothetical protein